MSSAYTEAGVDIEAGERAVSLMKQAVQATYGPEVLQGIGAFGGLFDVSALQNMQAPVLVASTDSVGTKTKIAVMTQRYDTVGQDIVNHCLNDILVQGAQPLFFMDYVAASHIDPEMIASIVGGCAQACQAAGCALLGGETAELPGVYQPDEFDLVGSIVGVVDRHKITDGHEIVAGDQLIGLASSGIHTNGFSLVRRVFANYDLAAELPELGQTLGDTLLEPHRSYLDQIRQLWAADITIKGMAHITGGGLIGNLPRILPDQVSAVLESESWPVPPIFSLIAQIGKVEAAEMARVFNTGLGMIVVVPATETDKAVTTLGGQAWHVGEIVPNQSDLRVQIR